MCVIAPRPPVRWRCSSSGRPHAVAVGAVMAVRAPAGTWSVSGVDLRRLTLIEPLTPRRRCTYVSPADRARQCACCCTVSVASRTFCALFSSHLVRKMFINQSKTRRRRFRYRQKHEHAEAPDELLITNNRNFCIGFSVTAAYLR